MGNKLKPIILQKKKRNELPTLFVAFTACVCVTVFFLLSQVKHDIQVNTHIEHQTNIIRAKEAVT